MIRQAENSDLDAIRRCAEAAYAKYIARIGRKPAPMVADFAALIEQNSVMVEVDDAQRVRGFIVSYRQDDHLHLENVAVDPACQGQGIGRRLVERVEHQALENGYVRIELYTNAKMRENLALYPKLGYREFDHRVEDGFDRIYFSKNLKAP
jgi:ribosomal protein S18 acetylase RimI-like enzyme